MAWRLNGVISRYANLSYRTEYSKFTSTENDVISLSKGEISLAKRGERDVVGDRKVEQIDGDSSFAATAPAAAGLAPAAAGLAPAAAGLAPAAPAAPIRQSCPEAPPIAFL
ncbi:hypothetical protein RJ640_022115 [Escallonia rubra]|uniref:Uncharacterized protein n=1 Tax=Escallonia rubra TaxID=112253 RepID=A0AA88RZS5_9ASTE|nr:hypothetical protein RJ640_022115 [Escallonia rubra]